MKKYSVETEMNSWNDDLFNGTLEECKGYIKNDDNLTADNSRIALVEINEDGCVDYTYEIIEVEEETETEKNTDDMSDMIIHDSDVGLFIGENEYYWEISDDQTCTDYDKETDKNDFLAGLRVCKNLLHEWFEDEESEEVLTEVENYKSGINDIIEKLS